MTTSADTRLGFAAWRWSSKHALFALALGCNGQLGCNGRAVEAQPKVPATAMAAEPVDAAAAAAIDAPTTPAPAPTLVAPPGALEPLYAALDRAEREDPSGRALMLFFGDSHTAGDQLTSYLRRRFGGRFGDAGRGFVLAGRPPIRHYYQRDVRYGSDGKWQAELGGKKDNVPPFGMAGVRAHSDRKDAIAWVESCDQCGSDRVSRFDVFYLRTHSSGSIGFKVDDGPWQKVATRLEGTATDPDERQPAVLSVPAGAEGRHRLSLRPAGGGAIDLFGVALERGTPGVLVDALGVVGRRLFHLRSWDWDVIGPQLAARAPSLVVLQYGTNEAAEEDLDLATLGRQYDEVIALVRTHAPGASILVLGPPDMQVRDAGKSCDDLDQMVPPPPPIDPRHPPDPATTNIDDPDAAIPPECQWHTPAILPLIVETERAAAARNGVAFFDTFAALGGADQMDTYFHMDPSLAYSDHTHFTTLGYELWGEHLASAILDGYDRWKAAQAAN